jgi:ABC-type multidrug transport system permease subunit
MRYDPMLQLTLLKLRGLLREREALFWVFVFPLLMALALGIAFRGGGAEPLAVGVQQGQRASWIVAALEAHDDLEPRLLGEEEARQQLRTGKVALVVVPGEPWVYWFDPTRPDSRAAKLAVHDALQIAAGRTDVAEAKDREMTEKGSRYIDFLIPGLLGMNLMGTGFWGVGFAIVMARSRYLLKRLVATPMRRSQFLLSQITGRLLFLVLEVGVLVVFAKLAFDIPLRGSPISLAVVCVVGALTFGGMGLLVAARPRTIEGISGLMNVVMMPQWICSGVFFSTSRFPDSVQPLIQAMPLTAVNDALRAVMLDGASLAGVSGELAIATAWCLASFAGALALFRWT